MRTNSRSLASDGSYASGATLAREPYTNKWKRGRVVEGTSLLTKQTERFQEFESLRFRQF